MAKEGKQRDESRSVLSSLVGEAGQRPRVVLAVQDDVRRARRAIRPGVDLVELRIDQFARPDTGGVETVARALARSGRPLLATVRSAAEGGATFLDDPTRASLWRAALPHVAAIDVEIRCAAKFEQLFQEARRSGRLVVLSYHNFQRTPTFPQLEELFRRARARGADVVKLATHAAKAEHVWRLAQFTWAHRQFPVVTMAMGPLGPLSRLLLPLLGSRWVYTSVRPAHGQIALPRLLADLDFYFP